MNGDRPRADPVRAARISPRLWMWGVALAILAIAVAILGMLSDGSPGAHPSTLFQIHVGLGVGLVIAACAALVATWHLGGAARTFAGITGVSAVSAAVTGSVFFATGFSQGLLIDRLLAIAALVGAVGLAFHGTLYDKVPTAGGPGAAEPLGP
jgi:hypothetical protein